MIRLAHYSDIHVTVAPHREPLSKLVGKRGIGALNYYVGGRYRHFRGADHRISRLLEDIDRQQVDHAVCTGDITAMSYDSEFRRCAELYGERLTRPDLHTVLPGNHDRYTPASEAERRFERWFGSLASPTALYPYTKTIASRVTMVVIDVSRPTSLLDSSGFCGEPQRARLMEVLRDRSLVEQYVILALHYALLRPNGRADRIDHGVRDWRELLDVVDAGDVHLDLVLHGHLHQSYEVKTARRLEVCAGSATDLHRRCGYNVYEIDPDRRTHTVARRVWDAESDAYTPAYART